MRAVRQADAPIAMQDEGLDIRVEEIGGGMTTMFVTVPKGFDLRPALVGQPHDLCPCPHWGYMLKGRVRMHTPDGEQTYEAGQAFYWGPGHAPEALEDSEYVDFSPTDELTPVLEHISQ